MRRIVALFFLFTAWAGAAADHATVIRDTWGVPHIFADTEAAALRAHGRAQAEDRLPDVLLAWLEATGGSARVLGETRVPHDVLARTARHEELARERYAELSAETRRGIEAYVEGVRDFMEAHPEKVPAWGFRPEPYHVVALFRAFAWTWPWGQARSDMGRATPPAEDRGSNQWVVGPGRAGGKTIALIDPHLPWTPTTLLYEVHLHGGDLDVFGFAIPGTPWPALGHSDRLALSLTTGGPDTADVYVSRLHPEDPSRYAWEGGWLPIEVRVETIEVATASGVETRSVSLERTRHGPLLERGDGLVYSVRTAYDREIAMIEQWRAMLVADDLGEFLKALARNQALPQNLMYADADGNAYYARVGRVPKRPDGFDWSRPVPGDDRSTEWRGLHAPAEWVQSLNPPAGYMQSCNNSPDLLGPGVGLGSESYPAALYNVRPNRQNERGRLTLRALAAEPAMTVERAIALAVDTEVDGAAGRIALLEGDDRPAARALREWNRRMDVESVGATLYRFWMAEDPSADPTGALSRATARLEHRFGSALVPWGEVHRARRGDRSWPVAGSRGSGTTTLRSIRSRDADDGTLEVYGGQLCTTVVVFEEGRVRSFSAVPYGQSGDPGSPHYTDQGEQLFARGALKPTWFDREELREHVESEARLEYAPGGARVVRNP